MWAPSFAKAMSRRYREMLAYGRYIWAAKKWPTSRM
jgi:hypothetical protein